jgi:hypothetical protein
MAARMHDINCASARHLEAFADIPQISSYVDGFSNMKPARP